MPTVGSILLAMTLAAGEPALAPQRLYHGVGRPVLVDVTPTGSIESTQLLLLDAEAIIVDGPVDVGPGTVDLGEVLPSIWQLRRTVYLQLMEGDEAIGTPLVLQPMLSRLVPVTEEAVNPNGIRYTRIVGWHDEHDQAAAEAAAAAARGDDAQRRDAEGSDGDADGDEAEPATDSGSGASFLAADEAADELAGRRLCTGLRVYQERDVVMQTGLGSITIALRPDMAPNTAWNFLELCRGGFYEGVVFHRVVPMTRGGDPFVIQAGDPTGTGSGGPGYWLPIEPSALPHDFGVISMARDVDPDSAGSQFFICLSRAGTARLDGHYCAFGYAVAGREAIMAIADVELRDVEMGEPVSPPVIVRAEPVPSPPRHPGAGRPDRPLFAAPQEPSAPAEPQRVPR